MRDCLNLMRSVVVSHRAKNICVIARDLVLGESTVYGGARMYVGVRGCVRVQYCTVL